MEKDLVEADLVKEYLSVLKDDWLIVEEISGIHQITGKVRRIDAVVKAKEYDNLIFGIEFKRENLNGFKEFAHWFKQSITYTQCIWGLKTERKVCILIAPEFNYQNKDIAFVCKRLIGEFGIGFIEKKYYEYYGKFEYSLVFKDVKIWSSITGFNKNSINQDFNKYLEL